MEQITRSRVVMVAAFASAGAGLIHATAAGIHAHARPAATIFTIASLVQIGWAAWIWLRPSILAAFAGAGISIGCLVAWGMAKTSGISFISGLEAKEAAQFADIWCSVLEGVVLFACLWILVTRRVAARPGQEPSHSNFFQRMTPVLAGAVLLIGTVPAMTAPHEHAEGEGHAHEGEASAAHSHGDTSAASGHDHTSSDHGSSDHESADHTSSDHSTVEGALSAVETHLSEDGSPPKPVVTKAQQAMADRLLSETEATASVFPNPLQIEDGERRSFVEPSTNTTFFSIRDGAGGYEHFVAWNRLDDGKVLDPSVPESVVVQTKSGISSVAAIMYVLPSGTLAGSEPDVGGPLTKWHIHDDLCFNAKNEVAGTWSKAKDCPEGSTHWITAPMLHVWLNDTPCGRFAELHGQTIAGGTCSSSESHGSHGATAHDHSGMNAKPTKEEQQRADDLIAATRQAMKKYVTPEDVEAAGYSSIGDSLTGYEHFVNSEYLKDDIELDPEHVESIVFRVKDGKKTLATAMFIMKNGSMMADVPNVGGPLTMWHIHTDLCWGEKGRVSGIHRNGKCFPGGSLGITAPMLHVWVTDSGCGPFAGIEGSHGSGCGHTPPKITGVLAAASSESPPAATPS